MATDHVQRVRIYLSERDMWEGQRPLYVVIMERLQREQVTGATALQGLAGFGPGNHGVSGALTNLTAKKPVVIEWVDRAERIRQTLPLLDDLIPHSLVTVEEVQIHRAILRSHRVIAGDQTVGDVMQKTHQTLTASATLGRVLAMMLAGNQTTIPVIDENQRIVGIVREEEIALRAGLFVPVRLLRLLTKEEGNDLLGTLTNRPIGEIMAHEYRSVNVSAFIPQALILMVEWNYDQIPVLDRSGGLIGLLSWVDVFSAIAAQQEDGQEESNIQESDQSTPVSLVMQQSVPLVHEQQPLAVALQEMLLSPEYYVVVVDKNQHVVGAISDTSVFQTLSREDRQPLLEAMQHKRTVHAAELPGTNQPLHTVMEQSPYTISPKQSIVETIRRLVELQRERAPVVDEEGRLLGLVTRGGLLRALIQEQ